MVYADQEVFRVLRLPKVDGMIGPRTLWKSLAESHRMPFVNIPATCWHSDLATSTAARAKNSRPDPCLQIVYVGSFLDRDLPDQMIKGFEMALHKGVGARLTIVGRTVNSRSARRVLSTIDRTPLLKQNVSWLGFIPESDKRYWEILNQADAFVLMRPDTHVSRACFPTRVPHFMRAGKPLITSKVADLGNLLTDREDALILPVDDQPKALCEAIEFIAGNRDEALRIG